MSIGPESNQTVSFLKRRFAECGIQPRRQHGQNFLIDMNLLRVLVETAELGPNDVILEVGTGTGSLTQAMAPHVAAVVTVEIDHQMHQLASEELIDHANVTLLRADALRSKNRLEPQLLDEVQKHLTAGRHWKLVANLPYSIATPLLSNLLMLEHPPAAMVVTIQKELADRIVARPATKDYGALSVWVQSQCHAEIARVLPREVFWPRPQITSAFMRIVFDPQRRAAIGDAAYFHDFVRAMFFHRRKYVRSELLSVLKGRVDKPGVDAMLASQGIEPTCRAEELDVDTFLRLAAAAQAASRTGTAD
jgi:16S rRNA (adenine1518-N6/adenine1519-N6)-dimethyltransferase